tara:strand:+ start:302 stop:748 length:447 start_codon:yes stop_codon:yes gene_type:complete
MNILYKKIIILSTLFIISGLVLSSSLVLAQEFSEVKTAPETMEEAKEIGERFSKEAQEQLPGIISGIWQNEVKPVWQKMWNYGKSFWISFIEPQIDYWWYRVRDMIGIEIEKQKPIIKKEFEKEKDELIEELPGVTKSLWERFKELIK